MYLRDRQGAGALLAAKLEPYRGQDVTVLALPRGGVPVGFEVARALSAPLDVFVVRKLGAPGHEEFAVGAIASGGVRVLNQDALAWLKLSPETIDGIAEREERELTRREREYRGNRPPPDLSGKTVILVDDGLATGSTMKAALLAARRLGPARLIAAVPVGAPDTCRDIARLADEAVCLYQPEPFRAVGLWYDKFDQTTDEEVRDLLARAQDFARGETA